VGANGAGRVEIIYHLPTSIAMLYGGEAGIRESVTTFLKDTHAFTSAACEVVTEGDLTRVRVRAHFDSALDLMEVTRDGSIKKLPPAAGHMAGDIKTFISGRTVDFTRKVSAGKALPGGTLLPDSAFDGKHLVYIIHLPSSVIESNATRTEDGGHTLVWDFPLSQALKTNLVTHFEMTIPIPWALAFATGIVLLSVAGLTFFLARWARKRNRVKKADSTCDPIVSESDG